MEQVTLLVALIIGVVEVAKKTGLPARFAPLLSVGLGLVMAFLGGGLTMTALTAGLMMGLMACGLFSGVKAVAGK